MFACNKNLSGICCFYSVCEAVFFFFFLSYSVTSNKINEALEPVLRNSFLGKMGRHNFFFFLQISCSLFEVPKRFANIAEKYHLFHLCSFKLILFHIFSSFSAFFFIFGLFL